jgi:hypothetical protein
MERPAYPSQPLHASVNSIWLNAKRFTRRAAASVPQVFTMKTASVRAKELRLSVEIPNELTAKTLRKSKAGKGVSRFASKKALYADLGL